MNAPRNFIVLSYGAIGDALMLIALLNAVEKANPGVHPYFLAARQGALPKDLGGAYPSITFIDVKRPLSFSTLLALTFTKNIVLVPPSFGIVPFHMKVLGLMLSRIPGSTLIGFQDHSSWNPYVHTLVYKNNELYFNNLKQAVRATGLAITDASPSYNAVADTSLLPRLSLVKKEYIVLHPFAANRKREFPACRLKDLIARLHTSYPQYPIVITGGTNDRAPADAIAHAGARSLAGTLSLSQTAALIKDSALYIGIDTGITHLASLMGIPSVVIANRSNPSWLPTYNAQARVLTNTLRCGCTGDKKGECVIVEDGREYFKCTYDVADAAIDEAVRELLSAHE